jgi:hypothetical protein
MFRNVAALFPSLHYYFKYEDLSNERLKTANYTARCDLFADSANSVPGRLKCMTLSPALIEYSLPLERQPPKHNGMEFSFGFTENRSKQVWLTGEKEVSNIC